MLQLFVTIGFFILIINYKTNKVCINILLHLLPCKKKC